MHTNEARAQGDLGVGLEALQELWVRGGGHLREGKGVLEQAVAPLAARLARVQGYGGAYAGVDFSEEIKSLLTNEAAGAC